MLKPLSLLLIGLLAIAPLQAETNGRKMARIWKASVAILAASSVADMHSSFGMREANPLLRGSNGRFGYQGIAIKSAVVAGMVSAQYLLLRKHPRASKHGAITNFAMAGIVTAVAAHNYQRPRPVLVRAPSSSPSPR